MSIRDEGFKEVCIDAIRYRWLRENPAWETENFLSSLGPAEFDDAVDSAMGTFILTDMGREMLGGGK